ncbi:alkaline-phosphatase-like protein [Ilyonectria robusta]|uniref:alkaline-phosphatase-like protein n=1 Tax=Ilyonectria robusta TaxID=1079257 RepID=UPI001E8DE579|nr:alkaline-phosphatase-like protein [Ilyonectria robusta]KAH8661718.1 alkaline-phosphatase-like protein [Ilyonectria robusta]
MATDLNSPPPSAGVDTANPATDASIPNILFIMADQLAAPKLKMYNPNSQIKTPNLDRLASISVQFDSAYCPSPLCAPSRMSLISGLLPMKIGAFDNAAQVGSDVPTYAHYLRSKGYHTSLAGKMHFIGYEQRLTSAIYPGDFGWAVNWDEPDTRLEWYHNASSILQAGPCGRSNQLDYDEEVMSKSTQYLWDHVREGSNKRPFCLTVSLTHPHDPYTITKKYWNLYEDVDINLPEVRIANEDQDPHSKRLLKVCDLWDQNFSDDQIKRAKQAYYGSVSYVDDCIGRLLETLEDAGLAENTIVIFSGDHGDMLGERNLVRFKPHRVTQSVSTLDLLPTICDLIGTKLAPYLPMDGISMLPHLESREGHDTVFAEYTDEGTVRPMMMIRRGPWKYITCPADEPQLYNLERDPKELDNLSRFKKIAPQTPEEEEAKEAFEKFEAEANAKWDFEAITDKEGEFTSWDFDRVDDGRRKYIRSTIPLDDLERRARFPFVDANGYESKAVSSTRS